MQFFLCYIWVGVVFARRVAPSLGLDWKTSPLSLASVAIGPCTCPVLLAHGEGGGVSSEGRRNRKRVRDAWRRRGGRLKRERGSRPRESSPSFARLFRKDLDPPSGNGGAGSRIASGCELRLSGVFVQYSVSQGSVCRHISTFDFPSTRSDAF